MLLNVWKRKDKIIISLLCIGWFFSLIIFIFWWFRLEHIGTLWGFIFTSLIFLWSFVVQAYCFFFVFKMKYVDANSPLLMNKRVAMVMTKTPSEPFEIAKRTLLGMIAQKYPHDTWIADEDPTKESLLWYKKNKIKVSCRKEIESYHQITWPRRKRCKEGNLAYFYDNHGYHKYDFVVHMDVDHVPMQGYLESMLIPFSDPKIGYVAAPSICDNNFLTSWASRARAHSESMFHGPIQSGANGKWFPLCIGSHYAVRTSALKEVGGIGPELAEDYSTTLLMSAHSWRGVWTYNAEAHGSGPESFNDIITQDYQWSRSLITLFLSFYHKFWSKLSWRGKIQYTFTQLWYPINAVIWFLCLMFPSVTLITGKVPVHINFLSLILFAGIPYVLSILNFLYIRYKQHLRPVYVNVFSWENALFELARWPWIIIAGLDSIFSLVTKRNYSFKVTPKIKSASESISIKIIFPYIIIVIFNLLILVLYREHNTDLNGYYWFSFVELMAYFILIVSVFVLHALESKNSINEKYNIGEFRLERIK